MKPLINSLIPNTSNEEFNNEMYQNMLRGKQIENDLNENIVISRESSSIPIQSPSHYKVNKSFENNLKNRSKSSLNPEMLFNTQNFISQKNNQFPKYTPQYNRNIILSHEIQNNNSKYKLLNNNDNNRDYYINKGFRTNACRNSSDFCQDTGINKKYMENYYSNCHLNRNSTFGNGNNSNKYYNLLNSMDNINNLNKNINYANNIPDQNDYSQFRKQTVNNVNSDYNRNNNYDRLLRFQENAKSITNQKNYNSCPVELMNNKFQKKELDINILPNTNQNLYNISNNLKHQFKPIIDNHDEKGKNSVEYQKSEIEKDNSYNKYSPYKRDYQSSRYGDDTYNYYLNSPMRPEQRSWRYPPQYYWLGKK